MSPAISFAWFVVGGSLIWFLATETVPIALAALRAMAAWSPSFGRIAAAVGVVFLLLSLVRPLASGAATPPPGDRIVLMAPNVEQQALLFVPRIGSRVSSVADTPGSYTVVRGDSLWAIARRHLAGEGVVPGGSAVSMFWRTIFDANRSVIGDDPNLIIPGQVLTIPGRPHG